MSPNENRSTMPARLLPLLPSVLLAAGAALVLTGWWSGRLVWVQPRGNDAPLPANAAACLALLGLAQCLIDRNWRRSGLTAAAIACLLGLATLLQFPLGLDFGLDGLLADHGRLLAGPDVARMPVALALACTLGSLAVLWLGALSPQPQISTFAAAVGSLLLAYALTGLLAYRNGLNFLTSWQTYGKLGPHSALLLALLGLGLIVRAALSRPEAHGTGPRWLWMPITICGLTVTLSFWVSLRAREDSVLDQGTRLTMDSVAALYAGEADYHIKTIRRLAQRPGGLDQPAWADEVAAIVRDFPGYRTVQRLDGLLRTTWYWPVEGNEDAVAFDHGSDPGRRTAIMTAHRQGTYGVAAPLNSASPAPTFAIYAPVGSVATPEGFVAAELYYDRFFEAIDRRLNLADRYQMTVDLDSPSGGPGLRLFQISAGQDLPDPRWRRASSYRILDQSFSISLTPRPAVVAAARRHLPELTLLFGLGGSLLLGLVTSLAQTAIRRQRLAEQTSHRLTLENEERRRIEAQLKIVDERLNLAFESTQTGVFEWDVETDAVYCTSSIWKITGTDPAQMPATGAGWLGLLHAEDRPAVRAVINAHFRGESPLIEIEHCVHLPSGEWRWLAFRAKCTTFTASRQPRRVLGTVQNIHARKRADEALRSSQAVARKLSFVASRTDNAVVIADAQGLIEWTNDSFTRLTGREAMRVMRAPLADQIANPTEDREAHGRIAVALATGQSVNLEAVQVAADGRRFHTRVDIRPVRSEDGEIENFIAVATDITARIETEKELRRAKDEADAASRSKSEFLASMSHEIRTPMNGVIGMTSLLLETDLSPEQRDYVSTIRSSSDVLLAIINDILDFSRIESGRLELDLQPLDLRQCVEEAVEVFASTAAAKGVELAVLVDERVPACILGDVSRFRQILINLISNGVKFTNRGHVGVEVTATPVPSQTSGTVRLEIRVTDTGIGIPADRHHLLFQPFSQVDSSSTRKFSGTGLGLAICRRLVQLMGGDIALQSQPGEGSVFHFAITVPLVPLPEDDGAGRSAPIAAAGPVLVVDDLALNRTALNQALCRWQLEPVLTADVDEAVRAATGRTLGAAIVDHDIAGAPGTMLIARLRELHPGLPMVLLTAPGMTPRRAEVGDPLVTRLAKPLKPHLLQDTLRRLLAGVRPVPAARGPAAEIPRLAQSVPLDILLAEDNPVNRKVALGYLERLGYKAATAHNGREALAAVKERRFNLVFMDLQMPELDGLDATRAIRAVCPADNQPVIVALTANALAGDRERCLEAGMNDYITKPVKLEDMQATIQRHFGARAS